MVLLAFPGITHAQQENITPILNRLSQAVLAFKEGQFTFHGKVTKLVTDDCKLLQK